MLNIRGTHLCSLSHINLLSFLHKAITICHYKMDSYNLESLGNLFESRMKEYEDRLKKLAGDSSIHTDVATLSQDFSNFKLMIWEIFTKIKEDLTSLSIGLDRHEMILRRKVLLFHGIPETPNEKLPDVVHKVVTEQMKLTDVQMNHFQVCHRFGVVSQAKARPILIRFYDLEQRHAIWDAKTTLKGSGITVSEFLTKMRHQVFTQARKHFGIRNCWSMDGKIVIILPDKSRRKIDSMQSLEDIMSRFPAKTIDAGAPAQIADPKAAKASRSTRRRQ